MITPHQPAAGSDIPQFGPRIPAATLNRFWAMLAHDQGCLLNGAQLASGLAVDGWGRLHEKGGKVTELPCHHNLETALDEWLSASGLASEPTAPLFPTLRQGKLTDRTPLPQANVHMMIQRRATAVGIRRKISAHSFRATGITTYLQNGGKLEVAQQMAGHESPAPPASTTGGTTQWHLMKWRELRTNLAS